MTVMVMVVVVIEINIVLLIHLDGKTQVFKKKLETKPTFLIKMVQIHYYIF